MPSEAAHLRAASSNEDLGERLLKPGWSSAWAVVLAFYSALHWVDAFLARSSLHPQSHAERDGYVSRTQLRAIYGEYRTLEDRSRRARYDLTSFDADQARGLLMGELAAIRTHVKGLLGL